MSAKMREEEKQKRKTSPLHKSQKIIPEAATREKCKFFQRTK
jgi:hypothetical protein